jgi:hypothetical protein
MIPALEGCKTPQLMCSGCNCLQGYGTEGIDRLVTLGSPHQAPPKVWAQPVAFLSMCMHEALAEAA